MALLLLLAAASARALDSWVYVLSGSEIAALDPDTGAVVARTDLGRQDADGVYPTPGGKAVFVTHAGAPLFTVLDGETHKVQRTIAVEAGVPSGIWFAPRGNPAYVSIRNSPLVVVNEHKAGSLAPQQSLQVADTDQAIVFNRRGTRLYRAAAGGLGFYLESNHSSIVTVATSPASQWSFAPDFRFLWGVREGGFAVVDEYARKQVADRSLAIKARPPAFSQNGDSAWMLGADGKQVFRVSTRSFAVIKQTGLPAGLPGVGEALIVAGGAPWVYSPDTGTIWRLRPDGSGVAAEIKLPGGPAPAVGRTGRELALVVLRPGEGFACF